ncbi:hypothetical protein ROR02_22980 [Pararhodospirillum oryzae]|uniref:Uncharacterized protein n=2 Tax=Pararhodospirillum oryzae TaxID=478448 RepID=A0A512H9M7_9PROT|nr:hypothetical protein ROR02_22980 [Pararhodospirillum oryzae]
MSALAPQGIAYLSAVLRQNGFVVDIFDTTFYTSDLTSDTNNEKVYLSIVRPFNWDEKGITPQPGDMLYDFAQKIEEFQPDLLAISVVESTWCIADIMLQNLPRRIRTIVGGVFPTYAPEIVIAHPNVDYLCRGEGELALLSLCTALADGKDTTALPNVWAKIDGTVHRNPLGSTLTLDDLPLPDWSLFEEKSLYRPMQGHVYKTIGVETQRGCPYKCTYCNSPANNELYRNQKVGAFYRKKSIARIAQELSRVVDMYSPELIYFVVDTFLAMSDRELAEFSEMYQDFKIPFWMNTRAETMTPWRAEQLEKMNCLRVNIGIEHGNDAYRNKMLLRTVSSERMLEAFQACSGRSFVCVANSIIGFPDETRDLVFDTIEFNRRLPRDIEASGAFIFTPFHGTHLREVAVARGYLDPATICASNVTRGSLLHMPTLSPEELLGLCRVFSFYVKMEKERWPEIRLAESNTAEGERKFKELRDEFVERYRNSTINPKEATGVYTSLE